MNPEEPSKAFALFNPKIWKKQSTTQTHVVPPHKKYRIISANKKEVWWNAHLHLSVKCLKSLLQPAHKIEKGRE